MKSIPNLRRPLLVAALALLTTAGVAQGHAEVEDSGFKRNTVGTVKVHIQHGCIGEGTAATAADRVVVLVPRPSRQRNQRARRAGMPPPR
jgi:uncharacterized protein YcnI